MAANEWENKPKRLETIQAIIFNESRLSPPIELSKYIYRKEFHLSAAEMDEEPIHEFFTNLQILGYMREKERDIAKHGKSS